MLPSHSLLSPKGWNAAQIPKSERRYEARQRPHSKHRLELQPPIDDPDLQLDRIAGHHDHAFAPVDDEALLLDTQPKVLQISGLNPGDPS
jgi:hypothetical protein